MKELFMHELYAWLSGQHPGLKTFKTLQLKLSQLAADHPEQQAMCRLLHGVVGNYIEEFDEAPLPSAVAERAYQRLLGSLAELDSSADPARQLGNLNRLAALDLTQ
jgi:RecB family exonuclease